MLVLLAILASTSTAAAGDELELPPWPPSMRAELRADGWTCLSPATSGAAHMRLELLDRFPDLARRVCDARVELELTKLGEQRDVDAAAAAVRTTELERQRWPPLARVGAVLAGGIVGFAAGVVLERFIFRRKDQQ